MMARKGQNIDKPYLSNAYLYEWTLKNRGIPIAAGGGVLHIFPLSFGRHLCYQGGHHFNHD
jgi:hypothetical protein